MINPPPKYTRTAPEGSFYQHHNNNIAAVNNDLDNIIPPPAYSREAHQIPTPRDAQVDIAEDGSSSDRPLGPPPIMPQQAHTVGSSAQTRPSRP